MADGSLPQGNKEEFAALVKARMEEETASLEAEYAMRIEGVAKKGAETLARLAEEARVRTDTALADMALRNSAAIENLRAESFETRRAAVLEAGATCALESLTRFMGTERYGSFLKRQVQSALADLAGQACSDGAVFLCRPEDMAVVTDLVEPLGFSVVQCEPGHREASLDLGGFLVKMGKKVLDRSVRGRLERCMTVMAPELGRLADAACNALSNEPFQCHEPNSPEGDRKSREPGQTPVTGDI